MRTSFLKNKQKTHRIMSAGFTIVEIVVVLFIFAVVSRVALFHYKDFDQRVVLDTTAQDVGLLIRKAESESVNGRYPVLAANQSHPDVNWRPTYGVYINVQAQQLFFFYDGDSDQIPSNMDSSVCVNPNIPTECLNYYQISSGNQIQQVCIEAADGSCGLAVDNAAVIFKRPFPDANIIYNYALPAAGSYSSSTLRIEVKGTSGSRYIRVTPLGQISVQGA